MTDLTCMLQNLEAGNSSASAELLPLVYSELRRVAAAKMARESCAYTLQPTALVHEAWMRLGADHQPEWQNRAHFFAAAAETMRRILIDRARQRHAVRHGGGQVRLNVDDLEIASASEKDDQLVAVHEALAKFAAEDPRKAELVKLRYFGGLTIEEAAAALEIPLGTAKRWWTYARAWFFNELKN
jgi:RNA polymerase sigma factor (TIGR02999 family)